MAYDDKWINPAAHKKKNKYRKNSKKKAQINAYNAGINGVGRQQWYNEANRNGLGGLNAEYHALENDAKAHAKSGKLYDAFNELGKVLDKRLQAASNYGGMDAEHKIRYDFLKARRKSIGHVLN